MNCLNIRTNPIFSFLYFWIKQTNLWLVVSILTKTCRVRFRKEFRYCNIGNLTAFVWAVLPSVRYSHHLICRQLPMKYTENKNQTTQKFESWIMWTKQEETLKRVSLFKDSWELSSLRETELWNLLSCNTVFRSHLHATPPYGSKN